MNWHHVCTCPNPAAQFPFSILGGRFSNAQYPALMPVRKLPFTQERKDIATPSPCHPPPRRQTARVSATRVCGQALNSSAADRFSLNLAAELSASLGAGDGFCVPGGRQETPKE